MPGILQNGVAAGFATLVVSAALGLAGYDVWQSHLRQAASNSLAAADPTQPTPHIATTQEAAREAMAKAEDQAAAQPAVKSAVHNYVIFREVPFGPDGFNLIKVGMRFSDSQADRPIYQWCYIEKSMAVSGTARTVSLAAVSDKVRKDRAITQAMAHEVGSTQETLEAAQRLCGFM